MRSTYTLLLAAWLLCEGSAFAQTQAQTPTRVQTTSNQTSIWQARYHVVAMTVPAGTELQVVRRRGTDYEVVLARPGTTTQSTGFVAINAVAAVAPTEGDQAGQPRRPGQPRPSARPSAVRRPRRTIWDSQWRLSVNAGLGTASPTFTNVVTAPVYIQNASYSTAYRGGTGAVVDAAGASRITGDFGLGAALSIFSRKATGDITGTVPHPFFFNNERALSGTVGSLGRRELAAHIEAVYLLRAKRKVDVALIGGPSIFRANQDLVSDVSFAEPYPYDTVSFASATTSGTSKTGFGFSVGADVTYRLNKRTGVGGLVRFSRGSVGLPGGASATVGTVEVASGIRLLY